GRYLSSGLLTLCSRGAGHVPATRMNDEVLLPCANLERVPARTLSRLEGDEVLMPQLGEEVLNGLYRVLGLAGNTHVAAGPASQIGQRCGVRLLTVGSDDRKLTARMVERIC